MFLQKKNNLENQDQNHNMKKYKHKYLPYTANETQGDYSYKIQNDVGDFQFVNSSVIEKSTDWELIPEPKAYEIGEIVQTDTQTKGYISEILKNPSKFGCNKNVTYENIAGWLAKYKTWKIQSVIRLSDKVEFKVGSKIKIDQNAMPYTIESITLKDSGNLYFKSINSVGNYYTYSTFSLSSLNLLPDPILITEDGVEIFEGERYWFVWVKDMDMTSATASKTTPKQAKHIKRFSTKEAAQEYIGWNKPIFSKANLMKFSLQLRDPKDRENYNKFIEEN